jgi:hypothetical protein
MPTAPRSRSPIRPRADCERGTIVTIVASIAPYARFVRAEEQRWRDAQTLAALRDRAADLLAQLASAVDAA